MFWGLFKRKSGLHRKYKDIDPDEIFLDSQNLPQFDLHQFEGHIEKPIGKGMLWFVSIIFFIVGLLFTGKVWILQVQKGEAFAQKSENNRLDHALIFAERGLMYDRNKKPIAWNVPNPQGEFSLRKYIEDKGFGSVLGYIKYPQKDKKGFYYQEAFTGESGLEKYYNTNLAGTNGTKITETDALGKIQSESTIYPPEHGKDLVLSIDADVQTKMFDVIANLSVDSGFKGGSGGIMDVQTGEMLSMVSYPEFEPNIMTEGSDKEKIKQYLTDKFNPFLNRVTEGQYTPGSIVKPFMSLAALMEKVIDPNKQILSTGSISIPNVYNPDNPTVFKDWKAHGWVDMREAIAVSSDVYFYEVGGGYQDQKGLGILNIKKYMQMFGFGSDQNDIFFSGKKGVIPDPEWKKLNFHGEEWRVGNTYHTAIGQYGFQVTPIQVLRAVAAIANEGKMIKPTIFLGGNGDTPVERTIDIPHSYFKIVKEGMRGSVDHGTAKGLSNSNVQICGKTGTAELGVSKDRVNSWTVGFYPCENPHYAYAILMESGSRTNLVGATYAMRQLVDWMAIHKPEYLK